MSAQDSARPRTRSHEEAATAGQARAIADWIALIRAEYPEIPGLSLTRAQMQRLWNLEAETCDTLLEALVDVRFLRRTRRGTYVRADSDNL